MHWLKLILCAALSAWILLAFAALKVIDRKSAFLKTGIFLGMGLRVCAAIVIYWFWPELNYSSDPVRAYIVQARQVLLGQMPYRDFASSYSFLFAPLLAAPVYLWDSVGSIALFMTAMEIAAMLAYLWRPDSSRNVKDLMTVFAWAWFPSHFYWLSLAGYNSGMIASGVMLAMVAAQKRKETTAGILSAATFLVTKLLSLLFWPAIILWDFRWRGIILRAVPHIVVLCMLVLLAAVGIDPLIPVKLEFGKSTSGTLWFYWWLLGEESRRSPVYIYGPVTLFGLAFIFIAWKYSRRVILEGPSFDAGAAFVACTGVLFMLVSRKAYSFYLPMFLPFLLHVVIVRHSRWLEFVPVAVLGAISTIEPYLWIRVRVMSSPWGDARLWALIAVDTAVIASYLTVGRMCWKSLDRN